MQSSSQRRRRAVAIFDNPYLLLALASLFWSGNHIVGRAVAGTVPPFAISTVRWLLGAVLLLPFAWRHVACDWPLVRRDWKILLFLCLMGGTLFGALQYVGLQYTTALNVSVLNSLAPVLIVAAGALAFRDRLTPLQIAGIATSLCGVLVIVSRAEPQTLLGLRVNAGDIIILVNMAVFAVYATYLRRRPPLHWLSFLYVLSVVSAVTTLPFALWEHAAGLTIPPTLAAALAMAYVAVFPSVLAFAFWNRGVELIGAGRAGVFLHLIPLYSALLASLLLGERLMAFHVAGFVLILAGVRLAGKA